ncbi:TIGR03087 family PEP-CTERM/XrtA system glycosyltransferase [Altererythrobacter aquiaggeris]|uniref:TIGR03087 family PEP-CTERM/XrtA system glycosyltransferase n=1 Tax=Aestuarierythrobacter aquiaggeris TaxID=1898396 RepID=UPI00301835F2
MGDILFLAHRLPYPPDRGDKIRSHHILKALAKLGRVHVGCFAESESDLAHEHHLAGLAATYCLTQRRKPVPLAGVEALVSGKPVSMTAFHSKQLEEWTHATIANEAIETIYVFSGQMGQYVPDQFQGRVIADLVDVDSAKFEAYARNAVGPRNWVYGREARLVAAAEKRLARRSQHTLFVSEAEAALFEMRVGHCANIAASALRNGIDTGYFDPATVKTHPEIAASKGPHFVFTGQMDYQPNIDACRRVIDKILPQVRKAYPAAKFHIVGRAPTAALLGDHGKCGVNVWGEVPDVRPFVAAADVVLAPLTIARGVQNKVLEAMAMARPVLLSPEAATGIAGKNGLHFAVEASDDALVMRALALLNDAAAANLLGRSAREFVIDNQGWEAMLAPLATLIAKGQAPLEPRHAA